MIPYDSMILFCSCWGPVEEMEAMKLQDRDVGESPYGNIAKWLTCGRKGVFICILFQLLTMNDFNFPKSSTFTNSRCTGRHLAFVMVARRSYLRELPVLPLFQTSDFASPLHNSGPKASKEKMKSNESANFLESYHFHDFPFSFFDFPHFSIQSFITFILIFLPLPSTFLIFPHPSL